ncbi:hypothetical protein F4859DRAFT_463047 [Xylaria cf. heliscus]|nr:hypothetical protein F4859DRAFT_463047 [Xylaria cf. heliscus]
MERKAQPNAAYDSDGRLSRMQNDLVQCSADFLESFKWRPATRGQTNGSKVKPKVGIIGAGLAGLRCAEVLGSHGIDTTILEARDRIGGRVYQESFLGRSVDMGASWVHGTINNPIVDRAKTTCTSLSLLDDSTLVYDSHGKVLESNLMEEAFDAMWDLISASFKYSNEECNNISPSLNLKQFFEEKLKEKTFSPEKREIILQMGEIWGSFIGDAWEAQSVKWFWLEECLDGDNIFVADTHAKIIQSMADKALLHAKLHLSTPVRRVESKTKSDGDPMVVVRCSNGDFEFDEVVVTAPLGCLKSGTITFDPALTPAITTAVANASSSSLEKVFIAFPTAFWEVSEPQIDDDQNSTPASVSKTASFVHFLRPDYCPKEQGPWTVEAVPLSSKVNFGELAQPTLLFSIHGPCAAHVISLLQGLSPDTTEYLEAIISFFQPYYSRLPNYSQTDPGCQPCAALCTNWQNDELAGKGSYTNFKTTGSRPPGAPEVLLDQDILAMRAGVPERGIWLAGEHTAPFVAVGTATGAYWSGEAVGTRILGAHGILGEQKV